MPRGSKKYLATSDRLYTRYSVPLSFRSFSPRLIRFTFAVVISLCSAHYLYESFCAILYALRGTFWYFINSVTPSGYHDYDGKIWNTNFNASIRTHSVVFNANVFFVSKKKLSLSCGYDKNKNVDIQKLELKLADKSR